MYYFNFSEKEKGIWCKKKGIWCKQNEIQYYSV